MGRVGWWLVLLLLPALPVPVPAAGAAAPDLALVAVPAWASRAGDEYVVTARVAGPPGVPFDLRAELGDGDRQASRFWNGTSWSTSQRYAAPFASLDAHGVWTGPVRLAANRDGAAYDAVTEGAEGVVRVRVRVGGDVGPWASAPFRWFAGAAGPPGGAVALLAAPFERVEAHRDGLAGAAVADETGHVRLALPEGPYDVRGDSALHAGAVVEAGRTAWLGEPPPGRLRIAAFSFRAFEGPRDDVVEVCNDAREPATLDGVTLRDGEGALAFPRRALAAGACVVATGNRDAYRAAALRAADHAWGPGGDMPERDAGFALAARDELVLARFDEPLDVVAWGDGAAPPGWQGPGVAAPDSLGALHRRRATEEGLVDTDGAADWRAPRPYRLGQSAFPLRTFAVEEARGFVAPDSSFDALAELLDGARRSVLLAAYEFTSAPVARKLEGALANGTRVRVLLEDAPAGRSADARDRTAALMTRLVERGAEVRVAGPSRYVFHHAKFVVVDERWSLVASENFNAQGYPPGAAYGNRGWGVVVDSPDLARALAEVWTWDADAHHSAPFPAAASNAPTSPDLAELTGPPRASLPPIRAGAAQATLLLAPDHTAPPAALLDALAAAEEEILVQFLTLSPTWSTATGTEPNPLLEALVAAAERGVRVRVQLSGDFLARDDGPGSNAETARRLRERAAAGDLAVRVVDPRDVATVHNKGLVVDRRVVHVGSLNGNAHSATRNREVGLLLDAPALGVGFADAFQRDWRAWPDVADERAGPGRDAAPSRASQALVATLFTGALVLVAWSRGRRG